jgi:[NiFe] hydrogenase assembly HybE family chaperone
MHFSDAQQLKKAFQEVYTEIFKNRFWGLPIANHRLSIQVTGLRETNDFYTFCLVTPWMLNKIVVPKKEDIDLQKVKGMRLDQLDRLGKFWVANVISPMDRFINIEEAIKEGEIHAESLFADISNDKEEQPEDISRRDFFRKMRSKN